MIRAKLPDGQTLGFPEDTPEEVIDATVRKYLQVVETVNDKAEVADEPDENENLIKEEPEQPQTSAAEDEPTNQPAPTEPKITVNEHEHNLIMAVETLNYAVGSIVTEIQDIKAQHTEKLDDIAKVLRSKRKLIKDAEGNPIGSELEG